MVQPSNSGRMIILLAVLFQAIGKVLYGSWLTEIPSPLFVLISFSLTAAVFLSTSRHGAAGPDWGPLLLLNIGTALTFLMFFQALKLIEPAIVGAVEIGIGPLLALIFALVLHGQRSSVKQLIVCAGILLGCAILAIAAQRGTGLSTDSTQPWLGLGASAAAGVGAVVITMASKQLLNRGWDFGAVLAHRFYLIIPLSLVMTLNSDLTAIDWTGALVAALLVVSVIGVLAPLYLLQIGIGRCDTYAVMVTMAALPVLTFLIEGLSPAYHWSLTTAAGLVVISGFLMLDMLTSRPRN